MAKGGDIVISEGESVRCAGASESKSAELHWALTALDLARSGAISLRAACFSSAQKPDAATKNSGRTGRISWAMLSR